MNNNSKYLHIFLSFLLIFLPYLFIWFFINFIVTLDFFACYRDIYRYYYKYLFEVVDCFGYKYFYEAGIEYFMPTIIALLYVILSCKVTVDYLKNQSKRTRFFLYFVNGVLLSPIGVFIAEIFVKCVT